MDIENSISEFLDMKFITEIVFLENLAILEKYSQ